MSSRPCPLCRRQNRRCNGDCVFGEYFIKRSSDFENAYQIFGLNNMLKIMSAAEPHQREAAANSILDEGKIMRINPSSGCLGHELNIRAQELSYLRVQEVLNQVLEFCTQHLSLVNPNQQVDKTSSPKKDSSS
ncbi:putative transcription factor AS2-LOB family [Lupinus albus]|uniref:Putative transcription factor AS2-LOB family n=1 Tax=Lupinus albus TaxID=3870 RepID=A0A6A4NDX9_LUPAL|nr:putative transcription factor AS2-LOB family [Lupinus albus]